MSEAFRDLSPSILDDLGLSAAIDWLLNDFARYYDIDTNVETVDINNCFSVEKQIVIYRIFQEALTILPSMPVPERLMS